MDANDLEVDGDTTIRSEYMKRCSNFKPQHKHLDEPESLLSTCSSGYGSGFKSDEITRDILLSGQTDSGTCFSADGFKLDSSDTKLNVQRQGKSDDEKIDNLTKKTEELSLVTEDEGVCVSFDSTEINPVTECEVSQTYVRQREQPGNVNDRVTSEALTVYGKDSDGDTLLHIAIINEATALCFHFIQMAPWFDWLDIYNDNLRQTPLHLAVLTNQRAIVRRLMVGGANVEMRDHNGDTPLHIACRKGNVEMVKTLLDPVKRTEIQRNDYSVPYQKIPQNLEIRNFSGCTCLHVAAGKCNLNIVSLLLSKGARINNGEGKSGATILHNAADKNDLKLTLFLVRQFGINVNSKMYNGTTPIAIAYARQSTEIVTILHKYGAKLENECYYDSDSDCENDS